MKNQLNNIQQGDVLLRKVRSLSHWISTNGLQDAERKPLAKGRCVIAHGESGHSHVIDAPDTDAELTQIGERMLLSLAKTTDLVHEEHKTITLAPGLYEIGRVNEFDYLSMMKRKVID